MNGSEQGEEMELMVENLVAPPTASPLNILVLVAVAVAVEVEESSFSLLPILRENMEVMAPKMPPSSCDDDLDLFDESEDDLVAAASTCSRATRRARNSRQSSPIIFSHVFSILARSLSLDRWREVVVMAAMVDGDRWRISDDGDGDDTDKDLGEHSYDVAGTAPPISVVNATDSSAASRRTTEQRYLAMKSAMMINLNDLYMMMTSTIVVRLDIGLPWITELCREEETK